VITVSYHVTTGSAAPGKKRTVTNLKAAEDKGSTFARSVSKLTPCSTVLLEKLTGSHLVKQFPALCGTRRFITAFKTARHLSLPWPDQSSPCPTIPFLKINFNIILSSTPRSANWSLSLRSPHHSSVRTSPLPNTCYMPRPSHFSRFDHPKNIW
jgi:hypothetical protein